MADPHNGAGVSPRSPYVISNRNQRKQLEEIGMEMETVAPPTPDVAPPAPDRDTDPDGRARWERTKARIGIRRRD